MTVATPTTPLHVQTPKLGDIKPSTALPPSPLTPGSVNSTMASALNIHDADDQPNGTSAAEEERVIDISSPMQDVSRHDTSTKHEETTPHQDANLQEAQAQEEGQGPTTLLGLQCAPPVMLPPSPPLTVADPREGAESEASISAVIGTSAQPQNVAITPPNMQEEDVTNWRASMSGVQPETRREVLEEEAEGELEGEYDPYDLGYSPVTPVAPSGLPASRTAEGSRVTSDHPLRFAGKTPSPPPWELIDPPEPGHMPMSNSFNVNRPQSRRPLIPHSAYYFGPPPIGSAYHTDPIGQIGLHHPREIVRVERDYSGGELVQFSATYPLELEGRITPTQFLETINAINERLISAHSLKWSCFDNALSFFTLQLSRLFFSSHYDREMRRLRKTIDEINTTLYNPVGLNILWPRNVAFMFLEIEYY